MDGSISGMVVLGSIRKVEQAMGIKPVSCTSSWLLHQLLPLVSTLLEFLSKIPLMTDYGVEVQAN